MKKIYCAILAAAMIFAVLPFTAFAEELPGETPVNTSGDYEYKIIDGTDTITITEYNGNEKNVEIPSQIDGYTVVNIDAYAFAENTVITSAEIPDTVRFLGGSAFMNCTSLKEVKLPSEITKLIGCCFQGCTALESIVIPEGVTEISSNAFQDCTALASVILPESLEKLGVSAFAYCTALESIDL
ncbi:MAG: leucine-rich repeat domain-containing protein, partial [Candidatus Avispirillum sp.]